MSLLKAALELASRGFHVFPVSSMSKAPPMIEGYPELATRNEEQIKKWWVDPVLHTERGYNVGISTSKYNGSQALIVVDVDNKNGKDGSAELLRLELEGFALPKTYTVKTPTGGLHLFFKNATPVKPSVSQLAPGIDIRSRNNYVVGAGSRTASGAYEGEWEEIADAPAWLIEKCGTSKEKPEKEVKAFEVDEGRAVQRSVHYLEKEAPLALQGAAGDETTYRVACVLKDFGVSKQKAFELLCYFWNPRCLPPWDLRDLKQKIENAYSYGRDPQGVSAPDAQFTPVSEPGEKHFLHKINDEYALVFINMGHFILHETTDEEGNPKLARLSEQAFKRLFSSKISPQGGERQKSMANLWLDWGGRREYEGLKFAPGEGAGKRYYNLWRGFSVEPLAPHEATDRQRQGLEMLLDHALTNICQGDKALFTWLMGYFAHMIQKPDERPLTTLVFRGAKGVGKNALIDRIGFLLGYPHYLVAHDSRYLTSNFNGHFESCLCFVLDEAFWSGDKAADGKLKGLTTSPRIFIERKGEDPYTVKNFIRIVVIGNEKWLVPASQDERRYAVFNVGEGRKKDNKFFHDMRVMLDIEGGSRVLLHYLKHFDLSTVDVNVAPITAGLQEQKIQSLDPFFQWWHECLLEGQLAEGDFGGEWVNQVDKDRFRQAFQRHVKGRQIRSRLPTDQMLGVYLRECLPSVINNQKRREGNATVYVYRFPDLEQCRKEWEKFIGHKVQWE